MRSSAYVKTILKLIYLEGKECKTHICDTIEETESVDYCNMKCEFQPHGYGFSDFLISDVLAGLHKTPHSQEYLIIIAQEIPNKAL